MSLRLIYGKIGSGKTSLCIREALACEKHVYYITPDQFTFTVEKRICDLVNIHGLGGVEVISLKRLALRYLSMSEGAALPQLDTRAKTIFIQKLLLDYAKQLTVLRKLANEPGSAGALGKLFGEMKRYNIDSVSLREAAEKLPHLSDKLLDLALLFSKYEDSIKRKFIDRDDTMARFAKVVQDGDFPEDTEIYLDRFDGFDASEFSVIKALLKKVPRVTVTLCFHPSDKDKTAFYLHNKMAERLTLIAQESNVKIEPSIILDREKEAEKSLLHLERNYFLYPAKQYEEIPKGIRLVSVPNPLQEVHYVARTILKICREQGYLFKDIAVAARNISGYERYMEAVLPVYNIPFFMDRTIRIFEHPFTVYVLSALELITKGYTYASVFRYLKSGFVRLPSDEIDALENYVLATGIRGNIWKDDEKWSVRADAYSVRESDDDTKLRETADCVRRKIISPLVAFENDLKSGKTALEKCKAIYSFLEATKAERRVLALSRLFEKKGELSLAAEYKGVYNDFIDALDGVCDAFGDENISTKRLYEVLRVAMGEVETGVIPAAQDGVFVGNIDRIKGYNVKALFVLGVVDGVFPASPDRNGILNDMDRSILSENGLEFAFSENKTLYEEEHLIYKSITMPSQFLSLSYPAADMDGAVQRASRIYHRVKEIFPKIEEDCLLIGIEDTDKISVPDITLQYILSAIREGRDSPVLQMAYGWFEEKMPEKLKEAMGGLQFNNKAGKLSKETIKSYMGESLSGSVSRLEKLAGCPFSYFASYILGAKERKVMQASASDAGRFLHDFIDIFSKRLRENSKSWRDVDDAYIDTEFSEIVPMLDKRLSTYMLENSARFTHLFARLRKTVRSGIHMLVSHLKKSAFEPVGYELSFSDNGDLKPLSFTLPGGGRVKLSGRIDRVDAFTEPENGNKMLRIIDYKSGSKTFELGDIYEGLNLQLAVYISAICSEDNEKIIGKNAKPAGVLYFRLVDPIIDGSPFDDDIVIGKIRQKEYKLHGLVLSNENILKAMDADFGSKSDVIPARIQKATVVGSVATEKQFTVLEKYVKQIVHKLLSELSNGNIDISPYKKEKNSACQYCEFSSFCAHDGNHFRTLSKLKTDEIWERMEAET